MLTSQNQDQQEMDEVQGEIQDLQVNIARLQQQERELHAKA